MPLFRASSKSEAAKDASEPAAPLLPSNQPQSNSRKSYENVLDLDDELVRGISLTSLLAGGARLFERHGAAAREDPTGTFALSQQCDTLDYFCSHSWTTSRYLKYVALLVHFNLGRALIVTQIAMFGCM